MKASACPFVLAAIGCLLALPCARAAAITVKPVPSADPVDLGQAMQVDVMIQDLGYYSLGAFGFRLEYDPAILSYTGHALSGELGNLSDGNASDLSGGDLGAGRIDLGVLSNVSDFSQQADTFAMATVHFQAIGLGTSPLYLVPTDMEEGNGDPLLYVLYGGSVQVVPEPACVALLVLSGGAMVRRRRR